MKIFNDNFKQHTVTKTQKHNFIFNLFLGFLVMGVFIFLKDTVWKQEIINEWFDNYISFRMNKNIDATSSASQLVFMDFDTQSFIMLGRPDITPRDKIATMVDIAHRGGAKVIIIDMDFSQPDYSPAEKRSGDTETLDGLSRDKKLFQAIARVKIDNGTATKLLLPQTTYSDKTQKNNIFSTLVDNKKIFTVTPMFTINHLHDQTVRFWLPYYLTAENHYLWSIPLLTLGLNFDAMPCLDKLASDISGKRTPSDGKYSLKIGNGDKSRDITIYAEQITENGVIRDTRNYQYNRIQWSILPPNVSTKSPLGNIPAKNIGHWRKQGLDNQKIDCKDKIVIIGRADADCADLFITPVGTMPGMYVHGNSIATVLGPTHPHLTSLEKHIAIEILLIILTAVAFLIFTPFIAKIFTTALIGICWATSYTYFCATDEFVYLSFSFTSIGIHDMVNRMEQSFSNGLSLKHLFFEEESK